MRAAIVDQDGSRGHGERLAEHMNEQHAEQARPDDRATGGQRGQRRAGQGDEEGGEEVGGREEQQADAVAHCGAEALRQRRVEQQLEDDADGADDAEHDADARGRQAQAAVEAQRVARDGDVVGVGGRARRRQEDVPQVAERADVHGEHAAREERDENVAREDAAEGEGGAAADHRRFGEVARW